MTTLDDERNYIDPATVSVLPTAARYGLIGGLIMIVYSLLGNLTGFSRPTAGFGMMILNFLIIMGIYAAVVIYAVKIHKTDLGGYISFGRIFSLGIIISLIAGILSTIANYGYVTFIEPDFAETMVSEMEEMFAQWNLPEEQMEIELEKMEKGFQPMEMFKNGILMSAGIGAFFSVIIGLIMKKPIPKV